MYLGTVLVLILAVFSAQVHPLYLSQEWKLVRSALFCFVAAFGVLPACHWVWINGGFGTDIVQVRRHATQNGRLRQHRGREVALFTQA